MIDVVNKITESNYRTRIEVNSNEHSSNHLSVASIFEFFIVLLGLDELLQ